MNYMLDNLLNEPVIRILLGVLMGYVGFKIASKILKAICFIGITYIIVKTIGII